MIFYLTIECFHIQSFVVDFQLRGWLYAEFNPAWPGQK